MGLRSYEASPLTPLEERVFQGLGGRPQAYSILDDASVLHVLDDAGVGAAASPAALPPDGAHAHGRLIDNVIDRYGNRIASRSRRLARIVAHHRKAGSGGPPADPNHHHYYQQQHPPPPLSPAPPAAAVHARHRGSSSSTAAGARSVASTSPPLGRVQGGRWGGLVTKIRHHPLVASRARRKHPLAQATPLAAATVSSGSFDYVGGASVSGSTSAILQRGRNRSASAGGWAPPGRRARWTAGLLRRPAVAGAVHGGPGTGDGPPVHGAAPPSEKPSLAHRIWAAVFNFVMPGGHNRFGMRDERSYTESIGFLLAFAMASVAFSMWGTLVPKAVCSTDQTFTAADVARRKFVSANGVVSDFTLSRSSFGHAMRGYAGYDISPIFPLLGQLAPDTYAGLPSAAASILSKCVSSQDAVAGFLATWAANSTLYQGPPATFPERCPFPQAPQAGGAQCMTNYWPQFPSSKVGMLIVDADEVAARHASPTASWVIIDSIVYDVSLYVTHATDQIVTNGTVESKRELRKDNMFLPEALTQLFLDKPGADISSEFRKLGIDTVLYKQCMADLFMRGTTLPTKSPFACANTNIVAWITFGVYFLVLFSRMATAEIYARVRARKAVLTVVPAPAAGGDDGDDGGDSDGGGGNSDVVGGREKRPPGPAPDSDSPAHRRLWGLWQRVRGGKGQPAPADERRLEAGRRRRGRHGGSAGTVGTSGTGGTSGSGSGRSQARCLVVVPCFRESTETLTRALQGIARSTHADSHTFLWVINDGSAEVLGNILRILAHSGHTSDLKFYGAYSVGSSVGSTGDSYGSARVYAGYYECGRHRIPYVVVAKEAYQGRVDSLMIVLNFFRSLAANARPQGPAPGAQPQTIFLEEEIEARMALLGHPPAAIDYCLLIEGCVQIDPLAITQFVARMEASPETIALSGSLYPAGRPASLLQILQFFEFYLRHFVSPICESLSNVTCPLNQLFTVYRVRLDSGARCLGDDDLVASMDQLMKSSVRYRHRTWPGNDCLLVPRLVRVFPDRRWAFEPNARAEVELAAHVIAAVDPYERQWFRTRLVTLFDILRGRMLKRTLPIMLAHLLLPFVVPAATCMLYLEIVISMFGDSPAIVVSELTAAFLAVTVLLLLGSGKWQMAIYFLVYSAIALPFYCVWIPVTSFFSMNRVWYQPEQIAARRATAAAHVRPPENFEEIKSSYLRRFRPSRRHSHRRSGSSQSSTASVRLAAENADASSDSEPEIVEHPPGSPRRGYHPSAGGLGLGLGLGLSIPGPGDSRTAPAAQPSPNLLAADARTTLRRLLHDAGARPVEPESAEFYSLCEQALRVLIPKHPGSTGAELAVAVNCAADEILCPPPQPRAYHPVQASARKPSGYFGSGRPVSVIMEESDAENGNVDDEDDYDEVYKEAMAEYNSRWAEKRTVPLHGLHRTAQSSIRVLCRVLMRRRRVIVLDEATANVDLATDREMQRIIRSEFSDCTVLTIAHRFETIMDRGRIAEAGSPKDLIDAGGRFAELVRANDFGG
ncbi:hypothetical protein H4R18_000676 [Coemansia javaensis]|uniref:Chitin synthase n=1 Tax=Coemansia javaensis TaxID=2761396 RepID=A0A9W8LLU0_9FUNG|nr:hypothetical protein H4R18_000676 [Coemansia javaensis]